MGRRWKCLDEKSKMWAAWGGLDGESSCCWLRHSMNIIFTLISNNANIISRKGLVSFLRRVYNGFDATGNYVGAFLHIPSYIRGEAGILAGVCVCDYFIWFFSHPYICAAAVVTIYFAINYKSPSFPSWLNILSWFVWHERRTSMRNDCTILYQKSKKGKLFSHSFPLPFHHLLIFYLWYILVDFFSLFFRNFFSLLGKWELCRCSCGKLVIILGGAWCRLILKWEMTDNLQPLFDFLLTHLWNFQFEMVHNFEETEKFSI